MKKIKRVTLVILALLMLLSVAACNSKTTENPASTPTSASSETPQSNENPYEEKIKFTMSTIDAEKAGLTAEGEEAANFKWLKETYNVEFEFWALTWSNYIDQTRIWINSDSMPDIMMLDVAPTRYGEYIDWVEAGVFRPYDLEKYPNLQKVFDSMVTGKKFAIDGKLYAWPSSLDLADYNYACIEGYIYRKDWAKETGLYKEDNIYEWDEWFSLVEEVIRKDPGRIGIITDATWAFPKFIVGQLSPYIVSFKPNDDGTWSWGAALPETLEAVKFTKQLYDRGIIWSDQPMVKDGDAKNNFAAGRLFAATAYNTNVGTFYDYYKVFKDANPDLNPEECMDLAFVKGPDGKFLTWQANDQWSQTAMSYKISDAAAERWQTILDFLVSDEGYYFRNYGLKDIDWKYEGDEAVCLWKQDADGNYINPYEYGTWPWARPGGNSDGFSMLNPAYPEWIRDKYIKAYKMFSDETQTTIIPVNPDFAFFTSEVYSAATAGLEAATYEKITQLLVSKDIEAEWISWVNSKLPEVQPAIDELNANVKAK